MCGRFTLTTPGDTVAELFGLAVAPRLERRHNIAPTQSVAVVRSSPDGSRELAMLHWGLIPHWARDRDIGQRLINARAETAAEKPSFRAALRSRRCLVVADGFFEWARVGGHRQPYLIRFRDGRPFGLAGLWERWRGGGGEAVESCTILTTLPNDVVAPLHERMPVIVPAGSFSEWLGSEARDPTAFAGLLGPHPGDEMIAYAVSRRVNNPANDDPECLLPV